METKRTWLIYALTDPQTGEVRYVGVSFRGRARLREHLSRARKRYKTHLYCWLRSVLAAGRRPGWSVLEQGVGAAWQEAERRWIASFPRARLCNHTDGGEGTPGYAPTPELRALWSKQRKGVPYAPDRTRPMLGRRHSAEVRRKIGEASKGRRDGEETKRRRSEAAKRRGLSQAFRSAERVPHRWTEGERAARAEGCRTKKPVLCVETGEVFPSLKAVMRRLGVPHASVYQAIRKGCRCHGNHYRLL